MLKDRLLVAAMLVPIATILMWLGGLPYQIAIWALLGVGAYEYARMVPDLRGDYAAIALPIGVLALAIVNTRMPYYTNVTTVLVLFGITVLYLRRYEQGHPSLHGWAFMIAGVFYIGVLGSYLASIRGLDAGRSWTFLMLFAVWVADSAAYAAGRTFGKHKLVPRLSPNKTWEGLIGSLIITTLFGVLWAWLWPQISAGAAFSWQAGALVGFLVALISPFGDLAMSMLKRQVAVKDTGTLMGAHGGVLDRIDSWLLAAPLVFFLISLNLLS